MYLSCTLLILTLALTGRDPVHAGRIFGGNEAKPHSRPYMALVVRTLENKICGGFLVSENYVITAAHCQSMFGKSSYKVHLGLHDYHAKDNRQVFNVEEEFIREDYDPKTFKNDLSLLKLSSKAELNCNVKLITLAAPEDTPKSCSISGWGYSDENPHRPSPKLREVNVTLSEEEPCTKKDFYCCKGRNGSGFGDSGGPLVCDNGSSYSAFGVVSHTLRVSDVTVANYFVKIAMYKDWIESIIKNK